MFSTRYKNSLEFHTTNKEAFEKVLSASTKLKSSAELSVTGFALVEAERLTFEFMNLTSICSELLFGLSASVSDAKSKIKQVEGIFWRDLETKTSAADKAKLVYAQQMHIDADKDYNDLNDVYDYIIMKKKDFEMAYYYYREISAKR